MAKAYQPQRPGGNFPNYNRNQERPQSTVSAADIEKLKKWVKEDIDNDTIRFAEEMGKRMAEGGLSTSQIRNAFNELMRIQMSGFENQRSSFLVLLPKIAYATTRNKNDGLQLFYNMFKICYESIDINNANAPAQYNRLMQIVESVLAFHKVAGGKD